MNFSTATRQEKIRMPLEQCFYCFHIFCFHKRISSNV